MKNQKSKRTKKDSFKKKSKGSKRIVARVITEEIKKTKELDSTKTTKNRVDLVENPITFSKSFEHPIRTFWNQRYEKKNSSCVKPGTELIFEQIDVRKDGVVEYRIRRGKRNFFTTSKEMKPEA